MRELLELQDRQWEETKKQELGAAAIMGPKSSPMKRNIMEGGAPQGARNVKKRRKRRYPGIGEQWGEAGEENLPPYILPGSPDPGRERWREGAAVRQFKCPSQATSNQWTVPP